jgi:AcrR family transcriptional regulator
MGTKERKQRDKKEMVENILVEAMKLFLDQGYKNVTIRKIAEKIEYSPATIYLYFKDKDEILFTLQTRAFEKFYRAQMEIQNIEDPVERLIAHGNNYIKFALDNPEYYDLMFIMEQPIIGMKNDGRIIPDSFELLKQNVKACIDKGHMRSTNAEATAFSLWAFVHGVSSLIIKRGMMIPKENRNEIIKGAFEFLRQSIYK